MLYHYFDVQPAELKYVASIPYIMLPIVLQEKIHLAKQVHPEVAVNLAKQLDIDPVSAIIHQYRCYGRDGDELVQSLSDMKLTTR